MHYGGMRPMPLDEDTFEEEETGPVEAVNPDDDTKAHQAVSRDDDTKHLTAAVRLAGKGYLDYAVIVVGIVLLLVGLSGSKRGAQLPSPTDSDNPQARRKVDDGFEWQIREGNIRSLAWDASGRHLAVGGDTGSIEVWDVSEGRKQHDLENTGEVLALAFGTRINDDEEEEPYLYSVHGTFRPRGYEDCRLVLWHLNTGEQREQLRIPLVQIQAVSFSSNGLSLVIASPNELHLCDLKHLKAYTSPVDFRFPSTVAIGGEGGEDILVGETSGAVLLSGGAPEEITQRKSFYPGRTKTIVALASKGRRAAVGFSSGMDDESMVSRPIRFWKDWQLWDQETSLNVEEGGVEGLQFVGELQLAVFTVAFAQAEEKWQRKVELKMWNLADGTTAGQKALPWDTRTCIVSNDGYKLAVAIAGGRAQILNWAKEQP